MSDPLDPQQSKKNAAFAFLQQNDLVNARALYAEVIADNPRDGKAHFMLGVIHARQGDLASAEYHLRLTVELEPGLAPAWLNLGQVYELLRRYAEAESCLLKALELQADLLDARESLGRIHFATGRIADAIERFREVVDKAPSRIPALSGLITSLHLTGQMTAAYQFGMQALSSAPDNPGVLISMGQVCRDVGSLDESLQYFHKVLQLVPGHPAALLGETEVLERMGRTDEALARLQPLLPHIDQNPDVLILYARIASRLSLDAEIIGRLEKALEMEGLNFRSREQIHYLLGELYDRAGRYDEAFAHYRSANGHTGSASVQDQDPADAIMASVGTANFASLPRADRAEITPIFIVGMPRSGTSLVEQILASHPDIYGAGELNFISVIAAELGYGRGAFTPDPETLRILSRRYLDIIAEHTGGARFFTDKMPHNFLYLGLITLLFPHARIIHTRRDPLDTCLSCYFQNFSGTHQYTRDLGRLGQHYRNYERLMNHWRRLDMPFMDVDYEALVEDQEGVSRRMTNYCGLDWNEACVRFYESGRVSDSASYNQVNKPVYKTSVGRWRNYEQYLAPLREVLGR
ncbi:MAG: sulfotransferase [Gammaproteobacteria bacterium]|nr:sulfotransferase [Gammaproteobacteria bacterium]